MSLRIVSVACEVTGVKSREEFAPERRGWEIGTSWASPMLRVSFTFSTRSLLPGAGRLRLAASSIGHSSERIGNVVFRVWLLAVYAIAAGWILWCGLRSKRLKSFQNVRRWMCVLYMMWRFLFHACGELYKSEWRKNKNSGVWQCLTPKLGLGKAWLIADERFRRGVSNNFCPRTSSPWCLRPDPFACTQCPSWIFRWCTTLLTLCLHLLLSLYLSLLSRP